MIPYRDRNSLLLDSHLHVLLPESYVIIIVGQLTLAMCVFQRLQVTYAAQLRFRGQLTINEKLLIRFNFESVQVLCDD